MGAGGALRHRYEEREVGAATAQDQEEVAVREIECAANQFCFHVSEIGARLIV